MGFESSNSPEARIVIEHLGTIRCKNILQIGEAKDRIPLQIADLKQTIQSLSPNLKLHPSTYDHDVYLRCLRTCNFDIDKSATMYIKYCWMRHSSVPGIRELSRPSVHSEKIFNVHMTSVLKPKDALGRTLLLYRTGKWDHKKVTAEQSLASMMILLDELLVSEDVQRNGVVYIADHTGFCMGHARVTSKECVIASIKMLEDSFPVKCEEYHFINSSMAFHMFMKFMKQFMSEKLKSKIFLHGSKESLHAHVHPCLLPDYLGGMWAEEDWVDTDIFKRISQKDDYYAEFLKYGTNLDEEGG